MGIYCPECGDGFTGICRSPNSSDCVLWLCAGFFFFFWYTNYTSVKLGKNGVWGSDHSHAKASMSGLTLARSGSQFWVVLPLRVLPPSSWDSACPQGTCTSLNNIGKGSQTQSLSGVFWLFLAVGVEGGGWQGPGAGQWALSWLLQRLVGRGRLGSEELLSNNYYYVSNCYFIEGCIVLSCVSH